MKCLVDGRADVYAVLDAFAVTCPARQHAIKKLLCSGLRGKGSVLQDLQEARDAIDRAIQMEEAKGQVVKLGPSEQFIEIRGDLERMQKHIRDWQPNPNVENVVVKTYD